MKEEDKDLLKGFGLIAVTTLIIIFALPVLMSKWVDWTEYWIPWFKSVNNRDKEAAEAAHKNRLRKIESEIK